MKNLSELSSLLNRRQIKYAESLDLQKDIEANNKYGTFYHGLRKGKIKSDKDATRVLYGIDQADPKYRKLKSRLFQKMLNSLLTVDLQSFKLIPSISQQLSQKKRLWLAQLLFELKAKYSAQKILNQVLKHASEEKWNDLLLDAITLQQRIYLDSQNFKALAQINEEHVAVLNALTNELQILNQHTFLHQYLKDTYPEHPFERADIPKSNLKGPINTLNPTIQFMYHLNECISACITPSYLLDIDEHLIFLKDYVQQNNQKSSTKFQAASAISNLYCLTEQHEQLAQWNSTILGLKTLHSSSKVNIGHAQVSYWIESGSLDNAIAILNQIHASIDDVHSYTLITNHHIYYKILEYLRNKSQILSPIQRPQSMPNWLLSNQKAEQKFKEGYLHIQQYIQVLIIQMLDQTERSEILTSLNMLVLLHKSFRTEINTRSRLFINVLNQWQKLHFNITKPEEIKEFNILMRSNFLNSQNLNTFEPVNYGLLLTHILSKNLI